MRQLLVIFLLTLSTLTYSQISFTNSSSLLGNEQLAGGFAMGICDMNGDKLEDIIRFQNAEIAEIEYQNIDGTFSRFNLGNLLGKDVWSLSVADIDRNGINDMITGADYESIILVKGNGTNDVSVELLDGPLVFLQGSSFTDFDNDGNIDLFACHDEGLSSPYRGSDNGTLNYDPTLINSSSTVLSDNSGNYAGIWTDYDNDGDNDLYISKCKQGVTNPSDGRRLNLMFRKEADGSFTEVAPQIGLQPQGQSWATEFGDIDNDGDMDAIILNHDSDSSLYENDGNGNYTNISATAGIDITINNYSFAMQTFMQDYDNDGYLDILVTSWATYPRFYHNNGNKTFTLVSNPWGDDINTNVNTGIQSAAMGDLNNDGFVDMITGFANGINLPNSITPDRLYLNEANNNNWISVDLEGTQSNINGIGARVEINGSWGTQIREIRAGSSYGIMNSLKANFGIGNASEISSIIVKWPSGIITTLENPEINSLLTIRETALSSTSQTIEICQGDCILINGEELKEEGEYVHEITLDSIVITTLVVHESYYTLNGSLSVCGGNEFVISNGNETMEVDTSGIYEFEYLTSEGCDSIIAVEVIFYDAIVVEETIINDDGTSMGSISLDITGAALPLQSISWSTGETDVTEIFNLIGGDYTVEIIDANGCFYTETFDLGSTGLDDLRAIGINVYPNPFSKQLFVKDPESKISSLELYNHLGQKVIKQSAKNFVKSIDTKDLSSGIYILKLLDAENNTIGTMQVLK